MTTATGELIRLRDEHSDWLLTLSTALLILMKFGFAALQAAGSSFEDSRPVTEAPGAVSEMASERLLA